MIKLNPPYPKRLSMFFSECPCFPSVGTSLLSFPELPHLHGSFWIMSFVIPINQTIPKLTPHRIFMFWKLLKNVTLVMFLFQMNSNPLARSHPETCCSSEWQSIVFINIYKYTQYCIAVGAYWADFYKQWHFAAPSISIRKHYVFLYLLKPLLVYFNLVV